MSESLKQYQLLTPTIEGCSKADLTNLAKKQANEIIENGSSEIAFSALTKIEYLVKTTKENIKQDALLEVEKGNDSAFGVKLSTMGVTSYDYSECGDTELEELEKKAKEYSDKISDRRAFLKGLKSSITILNEETGETFKVFPPLKKVVDTIKAKF
jgi:malate/lactate dehydrogenase